jgi:hypothetical protein
MGFFVFELSCLGNGVHTNRQTLPGIMAVEDVGRWLHVIALSLTSSGIDDL